MTHNISAGSSQMTRANERWTKEEEELLRLLWIALVEQMGGRTSASVQTRLERLQRLNHKKGWPFIHGQEKPAYRLDDDEQ